MLLNLLGNAVKFTEKDGSVLILAEMKGNEIKVSVTDTGRGIKAKE